MESDPPVLEQRHSWAGAEAAPQSDDAGPSLTRAGSLNTSPRRDPHVQRLLDTDDNRPGNRQAADAQKNFLLTLSGQSSRAGSKETPRSENDDEEEERARSAPSAKAMDRRAERAETAAKVKRLRELLASRPDRHIATYEDGVAQAIAASYGVKTAEKRNSGLVIPVKAEESRETEESDAKVPFKSPRPLQASSPAGPTKVEEAKGKRLTIFQWRRQNSARTTLKNVLSEVDILRKDLVLEQVEHQKTLTRMEDLDKQLSDMQAAMPNKRPRKRFGVANGKPYKVMMPLPETPSKKNCRSVLLPAVMAKPLPTTPSGFERSRTAPSLLGNSDSFEPLVDLEALRVAATEGNVEAVLALSHEEAYRARQSLLARRSLKMVEAVPVDWERRRSGKVNRMQDVNALGHMMWDSFLDWKVEGRPSTSPCASA